MAIDRAVQLSREAGESPPTLRVYRWVRPTVTMGRFQRAESIDFDACEALGVDVVRRFTGGRGVLHDDEVTYSIVASESDGVPRGVAASYRYLCAALAEAYRLLGVPAELTSRDRGAGSSGACYLQTTRADLSLGERKLSGSAQVWSGTTVLQHGSFTLTRDVERESRVFMLEPGESEHLAESTAEIVDALGVRPSLDEVVAAIVSGFEAALGVRFEPGILSGAEIARVADLRVETIVDRP